METPPVTQRMHLILANQMVMRHAIELNMEFEMLRALEGAPGGSDESTGHD